MMLSRCIVTYASFTLLHSLCANAQRSQSNTPDWASLNSSVHGRLYESRPVAQPCFSSYDQNSLLQPNSDECANVEKSWTDTQYRVSQFGAYEQIFSERLNGTGCDLNVEQLTDSSTLSGTCYQGSIPPFYIDVREPGDVAAAMQFSNKTGIPLVVKNTGHDFQGRSSGPGTLALWMANIKNSTFHNEFVAEGCNTEATRAITNQAGAHWVDTYTVADTNNVTVVGGAFRTVGSSGGWLTGGGHGFLTGELGLGVDNVLQFKVVTPDSQVRVANGCQNQDLFWALRGGGGSAFGVIMESTIVAHPGFNDIKVALIEANNITLDAQMDIFRIVAQNRIRWGQEGWGGIVLPENTPGNIVIILVNPTLSSEDATNSLSSLTSHVEALNNTNGVKVVENGFKPGGSWLFVLNNYVSTVPVGLGAAIASRLVPKSLLESNTSIDSVVDAVKSAAQIVGPGLWSPVQVLLDTPMKTPDSNVSTSVTPSWRSSAFQFVVGSTYTANASRSDEKAALDAVGKGILPMRNISPGSGSYLNEADIFEPDFSQSFWGSNYQRLLQIKRKYDPSNLLTGWNYVGFDKGSALYERYNI